MSVQFRPRTPGEYARIIWKRKWLIILPMIAIASAITWVVLRLPDIYESSTLIVVKPSTIPTTVMPTVSEDMLTRQLTTITQVVTSRSSLEPLVVKYRLYDRELRSGEPMESIIDRMKRDIKVEVNTSRNDVTNGFNITYRGSDPATTKNVTAELAAKYIDQQTEASSNAGRQTKEFFDRQVEQAKADLDAVDQKRLEFMRENLTHLPTQGESLGVQLTGLFEQQKSYIADIGRLRDQQATLSQQLGDLNKQKQQEIENAIEELNDPKKSPEYLTLSQRESDTEAEIRTMLTTLKPANPDVIKKKEELADLQSKMGRVIAEGKAKAEEKRKRLETYVDPRINQVKYNMEYAKGEIARQQKLLDDTNAQIASIQQRINEVPGAQVGLEALDREYQTRKANYDSLLAQQQKADLLSGMQSSQQGVSISIVDAANLPERPVAPKRPMLIIMGTMIGLLVGFAFAAAFEVPRLLTIQTTNDAEHYTGLPVLVAVPELLTPQEARSLPRRRLMLIAAGIVATVISIPVMAYALKLTHILDRFVS
jgi:polysaccharide chain length determinant protein (PEP-CTERM system associated)